MHGNEEWTEGERRKQTDLRLASKSWTELRMVYANKGVTRMGNKGWVRY